MKNNCYRKIFIHGKSIFLTAWNAKKKKTALSPSLFLSHESFNIKKFEKKKNNIRGTNLTIILVVTLTIRTEKNIFIHMDSWNGAQKSNLLTTNLPHSQMKNWERIKTKIARIDIYVKVSALCTNEWQNLPTTDRPVPTRCNRAFRTAAVHFSPFYTRRQPPGLHRSDRYNNACQFSGSFSPSSLSLSLSLSLNLLRPKKNHFYSEQFQRLLLTSLPRAIGARFYPRACICATSYAIHFLFYTHFSIPRTHLISRTVNHCDVNYLEVLPQSPGIAVFHSWIAPTNCVAISVTIENARGATRLFSSILNRHTVIEPLFK